MNRQGFGSVGRGLEESGHGGREGGCPVRQKGAGRGPWWRLCTGTVVVCMVRVGLARICKSTSAKARPRAKGRRPLSNQQKQNNFLIVNFRSGKHDVHDPWHSRWIGNASVDPGVRPSTSVLVP